MRKILPHQLIQGRVRTGPLGTSHADGFNGLFLIDGPQRMQLRIIANDGTGWEEEGFAPPVWEHVSVSLRHRTPTWSEMCFVKELFWSPEEEVIQFHPRASEYVNHHPYCLHLWRPIGIELPRPPKLTVGPSAEDAA